MASATARAQVTGSGSSDSMTAFVMNQPTESCQRSSWRECTGRIARRGSPAASAKTPVMTEVAIEIIRTPSAREWSENRSSSSASSTSRSSTTSGGGVDRSPSGSGNVGITPAIR